MQVDKIIDLEYYKY